MLTSGTQLGPFEIHNLLGAGGMGEVYRAVDHRLGREVALKVLPRHAVEDDVAVDRFIREARAASALNHPNVITIYEIGQADAGRFIAMELVDGTTLRSLIGTPLPHEELVRVGAQVARALAVAHGAGIVHRDVKPENVMRRSDGFIKVLDFGLARLLRAPDSRNGMSEAGLTMAGLAVGTLRYMSPEQACAEPVSSATDVFSLGVMLYELATGRHPFAAPSEAATLAAMLTSSAATPSSIDPRVPAEMDAIILRMLEKDASKRPTAAEVESAFNDLRMRSSSRAAVETPVTPATPLARSTVGRDAERRILTNAFDAAAAGHGSMVSIAGEPGMGKSTLVDEFLAELAASARAHRIARGRCSERLAGTEAYLPLLEALETLARGRSGEAVLAVMKRAAPTWYLQIASAGAIESSSDAKAVSNAQAPSQERMKLELVSFFNELASSIPVVLFFDDLHWADNATIDMLAYLAPRITGMHLLMLVTVRPEELLLNKHPFAPLKLDLQSRGLCTELALEFLTRADVDHYLALEFPGHAFGDSLAALIHEKTEGSPLFMADILRYLRTRGVVSNESGGWTLAHTVAGIARELPESVRAMIQRKIEQLSDDDRKLLSAASVQGYEFDSAVVAELTSVDAADVEERLEMLEHVHRFVRRARERDLPDGTLSVRYRFVHVLYQNVLYGAIAPSRRASLSAAAARSLAMHYGDASADIAADLALLYQAGRDTPLAIKHLTIAAARAARVFAAQEAAALARRGLDLLATLPDTQGRARQEILLQTILGAALSAMRGFAFPESGERFARAYQLWKELGLSPEFLSIAGGLWAFHIVGGQLQTSVEIGLEMLRIADECGDDAMSVAANNALGISYHHLGDHMRAQQHFDEGFSRYRPEFRASFAGFALDPGVAFMAESARVLWVLGYPDRALQRSNEALKVAEAVGQPEGLAFARVFGTFVNQLRGDGAKAREHAEAVHALAQSHSIVTSHAWAMAAHGWVIGLQSDVEAGIAEMRESLAFMAISGLKVARPQFEAHLAEVLISAQREDEALDVIESALSLAAETGDRYWDSELNRLKGEILMTRGATADAESCFRIAMEDARGRAATSFELRAALSLSRLLEDRGDREEGRQLVGAIYDRYTEGFDTADLQAARLYLNAM